MDRLRLPSCLDTCQSVLIAGAGGGFDIFAGLPLYATLKAAGKKVVLANLSFTYLGGTDAAMILPNLARISAATEASGSFFPEGVLARFLAQDPSLATEIYAFDKTGVRPIQTAYEHLVREHAIDAIILVDGGTDILMRGDEAGLGTPAEDMVSLASVANLKQVSTRLVFCLGFGIDSYHGICHAHFLENVAALSKTGAFLGSSLRYRIVTPYQKASPTAKRTPAVPVCRAMRRKLGKAHSSSPRNVPFVREQAAQKASRRRSGATPHSAADHGPAFLAVQIWW